MSAARATAPEAALDEAFRSDLRGRSPLLSGEGVRPRSRLPILGRGSAQDDIPFASPDDTDEADDADEAADAALGMPAAPAPAEATSPELLTEAPDREEPASAETAVALAAPPLVALDEAIEEVLTSDVPAAPSAGRACPPSVDVDVLAPTLTMTTVEREQLLLTASPLRSFQQVDEFRMQFAALEGVLDLHVGRFFRGGST